MTQVGLRTLDGNPPAIPTDALDGLHAGLGGGGHNAALVELLERYNRGGREALIVPADYLEVVVRCA